MIFFMLNRRAHPGPETPDTPVQGSLTAEGSSSFADAIMAGQLADHVFFEPAHEIKFFWMALCRMQQKLVRVS
jgi:hypothetical protein